MRWIGRSGSSNVEDRRGIGAGGMAVGGGILGVIVLVVKLLMGGNVDTSQLPTSPGQPLSAEQKAREDSLAQFVGVVLKETENVWNDYFSKEGQQYVEPKL